MIPVLIAAAVGLVLVIGLFKAVWKVAEANEALVISGFAAKGEPDEDGVRGDFKIVVSSGAVVIPGFQTVRRLDLGSRSTGLTVKAVSKEAIPVNVKGVVAFKIADDLKSINNAARRFRDASEQEIVATIHEVFEGHLRAIVGGLEVAEMLHDREALTSAIRDVLVVDMEKLGLIVDTLLIQEITDDVDFIKNLGKPKAAEVAAAAEIAAAQRDKEATEAIQAAEAEKAAARRDSEIKQAGYLAEVQRAQAEAAQAGPLMQAQARQQVVRAETEAAELDAQRQEKILDTQIRKPADAEAYRQTTLAEAERDAAIARAQAEAKQVELRGEAEAKATKATGEAQADATKAKGLAEAAGIEARAKALAENQDAVIAQQIAENYPEIVRAGASALGNIDNLVVLNGADGMEDMLGKALTMGGAGLGLAQNLIQSIKSGATGAESNQAA